MANKVLYDIITNRWINYDTPPIQVKSEKNDDFIASKAESRVFQLGYDDPAYLTFRIEFGDWGASISDKSTIRSKMLSNFFNVYKANYDLLPMGLLDLNYTDTGKNPFNEFQTQKSYNAYNWFINRNENTRAEYIYTFVNGLYEIQHDYPYLFSSIQGIDLLELFKEDLGQRLKDAKITIRCDVESISMKMYTLLQLYRKAVWDDIYLRWALPENLREFKMIIYVFERRTFQGYDRIKTLERNSDLLRREENGIAMFDADLPILAYECEPCEIEIGNTLGSDLKQDWTGEHHTIQFSIKVKNCRSYYSNKLLEKTHRLFIYDLMTNFEKTIPLYSSNTSDKVEEASSIADAKRLYLRKNFINSETEYKVIDPGWFKSELNGDSADGWNYILQYFTKVFNPHRLHVNAPRRISSNNSYQSEITLSSIAMNRIDYSSPYNINYKDPRMTLSLAILDDPYIYLLLSYTTYFSFTSYLVQRITDWIYSKLNRRYNNMVGLVDTFGYHFVGNNAYGLIEDRPPVIWDEKIFDNPHIYDMVETVPLEDIIHQWDEIDTELEGVDTPRVEDIIHLYDINEFGLIGVDTPRVEDIIHLYDINEFGLVGVDTPLVDSIVKQYDNINGNLFGVDTPRVEDIIHLYDINEFGLIGVDTPLVDSIVKLYDDIDGDLIGVDTPRIEDIIHLYDINEFGLVGIDTPLVDSIVKLYDDIDGNLIGVDTPRVEDIIHLYDINEFGLVGIDTPLVDSIVKLYDGIKGDLVGVDTPLVDSIVKQYDDIDGDLIGVDTPRIEDIIHLYDINEFGLVGIDTPLVDSIVKQYDNIDGDLIGVDTPRIEDLLHQYDIDNNLIGVDTPLVDSIVKQYDSIDGDLIGIDTPLVDSIVKQYDDIDGNLIGVDTPRIEDIIHQYDIENDLIGVDTPLVDSIVNLYDDEEILPTLEDPSLWSYKNEIFNVIDDVSTKYSDRILRTPLLSLVTDVMSTATENAEATMTPIDLTTLIREKQVLKDILENSKVIEDGYTLDNGSIHDTELVGLSPEEMKEYQDYIESLKRQLALSTLEYLDYVTKTLFVKIIDTPYDPSTALNELIPSEEYDKQPMVLLEETLHDTHFIYDTLDSSLKDNYISTNLGYIDMPQRNPFELIGSMVSPEMEGYDSSIALQKNIYLKLKDNYRSEILNDLILSPSNAKSIAMDVLEDLQSIAPNFGILNSNEDLYKEPYLQLVKLEEDIKNALDTTGHAMNHLIENLHDYYLSDPNVTIESTGKGIVSGQLDGLETPLVLDILHLLEIKNDLIGVDTPLVDSIMRLYDKIHSDLAGVDTPLVDSIVKQYDLIDGDLIRIDTPLVESIMRQYDIENNLIGVDTPLVDSIVKQYDDIDGGLIGVDTPLVDSIVKLYDSIDGDLIGIDTPLVESIMRLYDIQSGDLIGIDTPLVESIMHLYDIDNDLIGVDTPRVDEMLLKFDIDSDLIGVDTPLVDDIVRQYDKIKSDLIGVDTPLVEELLKNYEIENDLIGVDTPLVDSITSLYDGKKIEIDLEKPVLSDRYTDMRIKDGGIEDASIRDAYGNGIQSNLVDIANSILSKATTKPDMEFIKIDMDSSRDEKSLLDLLKNSPEFEEYVDVVGLHQGVSEFLKNVIDDDDLKDKYALHILDLLRQLKNFTLEYTEVIENTDFTRLIESPYDASTAMNMILPENDPLKMTEFVKIIDDSKHLNNYIDNPLEEPKKPNATMITVLILEDLKKIDNNMALVGIDEETIKNASFATLVTLLDEINKSIAITKEVKRELLKKLKDYILRDPEIEKRIKNRKFKYSSFKDTITEGGLIDDIHRDHVDFIV